jgi:sortase (surface protein transpeptidase)
MKNLVLIFLFLAFFSVIGLFIGKYLLLPQKTNTLGLENSQQIKNVGSNTPEPESSADVEVRTIPITLQIPKINVKADVESVAMDKEGKMDIPKKDENVAWYNLGGRVGKMGNAVFAGHLDTKTGSPAVFWDISKLTVGDEISVLDDQGKKYIYKVVNKKTYPDARFPLQEVFGDTTKKRLNLITCQGTYDKSAHNYSDRLVVYSELVE